MKFIIIVEQPLFQNALVDLLNNRFDRIDVECVITAAAAIECLDSTSADLVLADFSVDDVRGRPGFEGVVSAAGAAKVVALDARPVNAHCRRAFAAGARGYISMTSSPDLIGAAVALVMAGGVYAPPKEEGGLPPSPPPSAVLSPRQVEVRDLLLEGRTNAEIAAALSISIATAKLHVHAVLRATGARNRIDLVLKSQQPPLPRR
jgi:DNA-binding NarL/FixJ family response regulator